MATDDLKQHVNSSHDFYALLGVESTCADSELRRAYRKTALKYHPDKVGANDQGAVEKFHLLQIAYDVLSDATTKELYDQVRRAREEKEKRRAEFKGQRKAMMEELEKRESGAFKRKRDEMDVEQRLEREITRLAEDGKRRRKERAEQLRQEALAMEEQDGRPEEAFPPRATHDSVSDIDRSVVFSFPRNDKTSHMDKDHLTSLFSNFGVVEGVVLRERRMKPPGAKHKQDYCSAVLIFQSIVGAHAAVSDFDKAREQDLDLQLIDAVGWAAGKEPEAVPKARPAPNDLTIGTPLVQSDSKITPNRNASARGSPTDGAGADTGPRKVPSFSFKSSLPKEGKPSVDELTMMRLKNAEKRRLEEKIRRQEAAAADAEA